MKDFFVRLLATGFGAGYSPVASGTVGTLVAVPLFYYLAPLGGWAVLTAAAIVAVLGVPLASRMEYLTGETDPGKVVIDEIAGYLLAMAGSPAEISYIAAGFFIFRLFDIFKPPPVRNAEKILSSGFGIIADDLLAGVYSWLLLRVVERFFL